MLYIFGILLWIVLFYLLYLISEAAKYLFNKETASNDKLALDVKCTSNTCHLTESLKSVQCYIKEHYLIMYVLKYFNNNSNSNHIKKHLLFSFVAIEELCEIKIFSIESQSIATVKEHCNTDILSLKKAGLSQRPKSV
uniref:Uncharacterized protein n=1 Tax=Glossina brevipalpis TaxID=37001 RepID=A0A1A9W523_9MUSC